MSPYDWFRFGMLYGELLGKGHMEGLLLRPCPSGLSGEVDFGNGDKVEMWTLYDRDEWVLSVGYCAENQTFYVSPVESDSPQEWK